MGGSRTGVARTIRLDTVKAFNGPGSSDQCDAAMTQPDPHGVTHKRTGQGRHSGPDDAKDDALPLLLMEKEG